MATRASKYELWLAAARRNGTKLAPFDCPKCGTVLHTPTPKAGDVWDSTATCPYCDVVFMKVIGTTGEGKPDVRVQLIEGLN